MSTLEMKIVQSLNGLSDDSLNFILEMIQRFVKPAEANMSTSNGSAKARRIGSMKGKRFVAEGHSIDEFDDEIARMFGVDE